MSAAFISFDLAKSVFQVHGVVFYGGGQTIGSGPSKLRR
jgi:hypothetical protein